RIARGPHLDHFEVSWYRSRSRPPATGQRSSNRSTPRAQRPGLNSSWSGKVRRGQPTLVPLRNDPALLVILPNSGPAHSPCTSTSGRLAKDAVRETDTSGGAFD